MRRNDWLTQTRTTGVLQIAAEIGLEAGPRKSAGPCLACGAVLRSSSGKDRRFALSVYGKHAERWTCFCCKANGDALDLIAYKLTGSSCREAADLTPVREWLIDYGFLQVGGVRLREPPRPEVYIRQIKTPDTPPPPDELERLWSACSPPSGKALAYIQSRYIQCDELRQTPPSSWSGWDGIGPWWKKTWTSRWSIVAGAYTPDGKLAGLHARSIIDDGKYPKTLWHKGTIGGLLFANAKALEWMRGGKAASDVYVTEGVTDFWRCCSTAPERPVLGYTNGNEKALANLPSGPRFVVLQHNDKPGHDYLERILDLDPTRDVYQVDWGRHIGQ